MMISALEIVLILGLVILFLAIKIPSKGCSGDCRQGRTDCNCK